MISRCGCSRPEIVETELGLDVEVEERNPLCLVSLHRLEAAFYSPPRA